MSCSSDDTESEDPIILPFFTNVINEVGIGDVGGLGQTAAWGDFNGDGRQDLFVSNTDFSENSVFLFINTQDGTFTDVTLESGLLNIPIRSAAWGDFNNDGLLDLVVGTIVVGSPPILYENLDGNSFVDVSEDAGLTEFAAVTKHTLWVDYDADGDLDLFQVVDGVSLLYQNQGDGTFLEVSAESGLGDFFRTNSAHWFDFNNDDFPELFLANDGFNKFYLNNGDGTFSDITDQAGLDGDPDWDSISACAGDFNADGFFDLYVGNISSSRNALYKNNGDGTFTDITINTGTEDVGDGRTCAWIDFDADGKLDLLSTNHLNPTMFFRNLGNGKFEEVASEVNIEFPIDAFSASWGDYNDDGFMDVFLNGHLGTVLYQNSGNLNNYLIIELKGDGVLTNTSAIGSKVEVTSSFGTQTRFVSGGKGCCEQNMLPVHFGLGEEREVDISVKWTSGEVCLFEDVNVEGGRMFLVSEIDCDSFPF